jgi:hypothetical protein
MALILVLILHTAFYVSEKPLGDALCFLRGAYKALCEPPSSFAKQEISADTGIEFATMPRN